MTSNTIRTSTRTTRMILMAYVEEGNMFFPAGVSPGREGRICHRIEGGEFRTYNEGKEGVGRFNDAPLSWAEKSSLGRRQNFLFGVLLCYFILCIMASVIIFFLFGGIYLQQYPTER